MVQLVGLLTAALALSQSGAMRPTPDFSGSWTMDRARSESPLQTPPVNAISVTIHQQPAEIRIDAVRDGSPPESTTYRIVDVPNPTTGALGAGTLRAYWDGMKLVTEKGGTVRGQTVSIREIRALTAGGAEMTVETLVVVQHGYSLRGARNYASKTDVFRKAAP